MPNARFDYNTSSRRSSRSSDLGDFKALPKDIEVERQILGSMMLNPGVISSLVRTLQAEDFWLRQHQEIFKAIVELFENGKPTDLITVGNYLENANKLDLVGGRAYLSDLASRAGMTASAPFYAEILRNVSLKRKAYATAIQIAEAALNGNAAADVLLQAKVALESLTTEALRDSEDVFQRARFIFSSPDQLGAVSSASVIDGLIRDGELILWAGYEKTRKSTLVLQACFCLATGRPFLGFSVPKPLRVLYLDAESSPALLARRWQSISTLLSAEELEQVRSNLEIIQGRQLRSKGLLLSIDPGSSGHSTLAALLSNSKAEVIVFDPLRVFHTAEEDKAGPMTQVLSEIRRLTGGRTTIIVHHCRKRQAQTKTLHLSDDPYAWSDNIRGSNVLKAHADGIVLQELVPDRERDEILYLAAILKDNPNVPPIPLVESDQSPFWHERLADQSPTEAAERLTEKDRAILVVAQELLQKQRIVPQAELVNQLVNQRACSRATAYRAVARLGRLGFLLVEDGAVTLPLEHQG